MGLLLHGYKTISRFYLQNFEDNVKQEAIDLVVGQHTESINIFSDSVEKALLAKEDQYCSYSKINIFIITWNVSGQDTPTQIDQNGSFFGFKQQNTPDIVCVAIQQRTRYFQDTNLSLIYRIKLGLQEIIEYNAKNFVSANNESEIKKWNQVILKALQTYDNYTLTKHKDLYGNLTLIYTKQSVQHRISKMNEDTVKLGYTSYMVIHIINQKIINPFLIKIIIVIQKFQLNKNYIKKGAVLIKLYVDDTSINFLNINLDTGSKSKISTMNDIHERSYQQEGPGKTKDEKLINLDFNFLLGDLGFSNVLQGVEVRQHIDNYEKIKKQDQAGAKKHDELNIQKNNSDYLTRYQEESINFLPTYKYELFKPNYTQVTVPAWPDRIMIWCKEGDQHEQHDYNRREINFTNHRPVYANYTLKIKKINQEKKEQILQTVYAELNKTAERIEEDQDNEDDEGSLIKKR